MANYPTSAWAPTTKTSGQVIDAAHINDMQAEVVALENALLSTGLAHHLLFVDVTYDIGASGATRPRDLYLGRNLILGGQATAGELRFLEPSGSGSNYTAFKAQAQGGNVTYTLPAADGAANQALVTNGSGTLSWSAAGTPTTETTTLTGTQNDFDLDAAFTHLRCNNASALTLTGFTVAGGAPTAGSRVIIQNVGSSTVRIADQDAGSAAANRIDTPSTRGQIIGAGGVIQLVYDDTDSRWKMIAVEPGTPITVAHAGGDYTASSGTWTVEAGDLLGFRYIQRGKFVTFIVNIDNSSTSATPAELRIALPNSFTGIAFQQFHAAGRIFDNGGGHQGGVVALDASGTTLNVRRGDDSNFAVATNNTDVMGNWTFEVA